MDDDELIIGTDRGKKWRKKGSFLWAWQDSSPHVNSDLYMEPSCRILVGFIRTLLALGRDLSLILLAFCVVCEKDGPILSNLNSFRNTLWLYIPLIYAYQESRAPLKTLVPKSIAWTKLLLLFSLWWCTAPSFQMKVAIICKTMWMHTGRQ